MSKLLLFVNWEYTQHIFLVIALLLFIFSVVLLWLSRVPKKWYVGRPYEPPFYLLYPLLYHENVNNSIIIDSLSSAVYALLLQGYMKVIFVREKGIMGELTKIKFQKIREPEDDILFALYSVIPDGIRRTGLFGNSEENEIDVDDIYTDIIKGNISFDLNKFLNIVFERYRNLYGKERINVKWFSLTLGVLSVLWGVAGLLLSFVEGKINIINILVALMLFIVAASTFRVRWIWSKMARKFRGRWLGFKEKVSSGNVEIDDFYLLLGYTFALGVPHAFLDVVKRQIIEEKVNIGKVSFLDVSRMSVADLRALIDAINMIAAALGRQ